MTFENKIEKKCNELREQADRLDTLSSIYEQLVERMKYDALECEYNEETGDYTYKEPTPDNYCYNRYKVWMEILKAVEKLA